MNNGLPFVRGLILDFAVLQNDTDQQIDNRLYDLQSRVRSCVTQHPMCLDTERDQFSSIEHFQLTLFDPVVIGIIILDLLSATSSISQGERTLAEGETASTTFFMTKSLMMSPFVSNAFGADRANSLNAER
jgi:hypothetical protein